MQKPYLSVIIPVKDEIDLLPLVLIDVDRHLHKINLPAEIIVAKSGADLEFESTIKKISGAIKNLKYLHAEREEGIAGAIKKAMLLSTGNIRLITEMKNTALLDQFKDMIPSFEKGSDLVIGRRVFGVGEAKQVWPTKNRIFDGASNIFVSSVFFRGLKLKDPLSSFKALTEEAAEKIFSSPKNLSLNFNLEILKLAQKNNLKISEVAVYM